MPYVYSTATADNTYVEYHPPAGEGSMRNIKRRMTIRGGAGLPAKRTLITPYGLATEVTDDGLAWLLTLPAFQRHMERGFITHSKTKKDADKMAATMTQRDGSAQLVPNDFSDAELAKLRAATSSLMPAHDTNEAPTTKPRSKPLLKS
jgi:hypothetical protein